MSECAVHLCKKLATKRLLCIDETTRLESQPQPIHPKAIKQRLMLKSIAGADSAATLASCFLFPHSYNTSFLKLIDVEKIDQEITCLNI